MAKSIGIDLGTTNSVVAHINENLLPEIIPIQESSVTPSVVYFDSSGEVHAGQFAKEIQKADERNTVSFFKRHMGDMHYQRKIHGKSYNAVDFSALFLSYLKEQSEMYLGLEITEAIITVPAYFNDIQRQATIEAGKRAGLNVQQIINEPTSASLAYKVQKGETILVYDLGGGTFDITIAIVEEDRVKIIATGGDCFLGGKDIDDRIVQWFCEQFEGEYFIDIQKDSQAITELLMVCEEAKKRLSKEESVEISFEYKGEYGNYELDRATLKSITLDFFCGINRIVASVLNDAGMSWKNIDQILLVGGSSQLFMVSEHLLEISGKKPIKKLNLDEIVAVGAAIRTYQYTQQKSYFLAKRKLQSTLPLVLREVRDVTSHSLGKIALAQDGKHYINTFIIPRNKPIPCSESNTYQFQTHSHHENTFEVYMTQGESTDIAKCQIIGKYVFEGLQHIPNRKTDLTVRYTYSTNGTVEVSAVQNCVGKTLMCTTKAVPKEMNWLLQPSQKISQLVLAIDNSTSMNGNPIKKAQEAALNLVNNIELSKIEISVVIFNNFTKVVVPFTQDSKKLQVGIYSIYSDGGTHEPLTSCYAMFSKNKNQRSLVVLTDGCWGGENEALKMVPLYRREKIKIFTIGFGGANHNFLSQVATSENASIQANLDELVGTFSKIAQVMNKSFNTGMQIL